MVKEEINLDALWTEAVDLLVRDFFKESVAKFRGYFKETRNLEQEGYLEAFDEKERTILNLTRSLKKQKSKKYCIRYLRAMIKIYKSFDDENLIKSIFIMNVGLVHMLDFTEDKIQEIEGIKEFLTDYGEEGLTLLDLSVMEVELKLKMGFVEDALISALEVISETSSLKLNAADEEFEDQKSREDFDDLGNSILVKAYIKLSEIYQRIEDDKKAFRAVQNARKFLEKLPEDHDQLQTLNDACENQQTIVLNNGPVISIDPEVYEKPTDSKKFNLNESVKRLHNGVGARKRGNHFDCVPNGVFVRENPFVRERLYKYAKSGSDVKNMDIMMERLHHGRKEIDQELIIHDQPFKNYTREGFLPHNHFGYKPVDYHKCSIGNSPYYNEGAARDRIEMIHSVKPKPIKIDMNVGTISADNKKNYANKVSSARRSRENARISPRGGKAPNLKGGLDSKGKRRRMDFLNNL